MTDDAGRLADIVEAVDAILKRTTTREELESDRSLQVWVLHHLQIIGEAMTRLSDRVRQAHPEVPWRDVIGMRNVIVHGYDRVRLDVVWSVVDRDLVPLRRQVSAIVEELD